MTPRAILRVKLNIYHMLQSSALATRCGLLAGHPAWGNIGRAIGVRRRLVRKLCRAKPAVNSAAVCEPAGQRCAESYVRPMQFAVPPLLPTQTGLRAPPEDQVIGVPNTLCLLGLGLIIL